MIARCLRRAAGALSFAALWVLAGCATNPVTGRPQLALISESQEIQMGQQAAVQVEQSIGLVQNDALQQYVQRIGAELAADSERPQLPWTFRVVDDPTPNAFALPGGYIFVTRGILGLMRNESELASVLGHEIGHVTARHSVSMLSRAQLAQIGMVVGQIAFPEMGQLANVAGAGLQLLFLNYGRDAERQADDLGFRYAYQEGYDVTQMADVFEALLRMGSRENRSALPGWLATHPGEEERIEAVRARVAALPTPPDSSRRGTAAFLGHIDRMVFGENPRNGFFRETRFYHPDMRFQLDFPTGWKTQNLSQAVIASSPREDAVLQLTLAEQGGAEASAQRFLSQQGIQPVQTRRETVQGNPAVVSLFQAQTQQGVIEGIASWIDYGGRTYQILGYTPRGGYRTYGGALQRTIESFRTLTDPQMLNVQPSRIQVVRLDRAMTLDEFNRRYPSTISIEELAIINQVEGPATRLPTGTQVKRVATGTG